MVASSNLLAIGPDRTIYATDEMGYLQAICL